MVKLAPIVLFVYNRPVHTRKTVEALKCNELANESKLYIYSDAAIDDSAVEKVNEVREYIKHITGFKQIYIIEREKNWGLANSIIDGVTTVVKKYGKIIVLEDDLVTSPYFLRFMNDGLTLYQDEPNVASVHGYIYPLINTENLTNTFFIKGADCWGWATWDRAWEKFEEDGNKLLIEIKKRKLVNEADFNGSFRYTLMLKDQIMGKNNSWAVRWYFSTFLRDMLTLYPVQSFVKNIGHDNSGIHCEDSVSFSNKLINNYNGIVKIQVLENRYAKKHIELFFKSLKPGFIKRITFKLLRIIK